MSGQINRNQKIRADILLQTASGPTLSFSGRQLRKEIQANCLQDATLQEVLDACYFLKGNGFLAAITDGATNETRYQVTSAGVAHYEQTSGQGGRAKSEE